MGIKPDKKQIKSHIKLTQQIDGRLKAALDGERAELAQLRKAADQFLNARIQSALEEMDVDMLTQGKQKIRVSYLRSAGIGNMWQLSQMSRQQIEELDGIGAQGATAIYDLTKQIVKNAKEKLSVRIRSDEPTPADDTLVAALYCVILHGQQRQRLRGIYEQNHKALTKEIAAARHKAIYLVRTITEMSLPNIGKIFNRDHSTIMSSIEAVEKKLITDAILGVEIDDMIKEVTG